MKKYENESNGINLIIIPFHDWRKSEREGFRTRDVHFILSLAASKHVRKVLVINRPSTWVEFLLKRHKKGLQGEVVFEEGKFRLTQVNEKIAVADFFSPDVVGQLSKRHLWFMGQYGNKEYIEFVNHCKQRLHFYQCGLINQNVFAYKMAIETKGDKKLFDAWDNFLKFPAYKNYRKNLKEGYRTLSKHIPSWITNSNENIAFYQNEFNVQKIRLVKNGVKQNFLSGSLDTPFDMKELKRPIVGYGGKISYLLNYKLINFITERHPDKSFVFVGQILDKNVYKNIQKRENVFFLGDKRYDKYPSYVNAFDICIVPYNIKEGQHGGDSMKAYEYLATGKKVIGTDGNGLPDLKDYLYIARDFEEFSEALQTVKNEKPQMNIRDYSWEKKSQTLLEELFG